VKEFREYTIYISKEDRIKTVNTYMWQVQREISLEIYETPKLIETGD
jgi:hypothetical protein